MEQPKLIIHRLNQSDLYLSRGLGQLQVHHVRHLHIQGALRSEQEQQQRGIFHLLRHDAERREHLAELQDEAESCPAALR